MAFYGVYDTKNKEMCVGIFDIKELMKFTHLKRDSVYQMIHHNCLLKHRYRIVKFNNSEVELEDK